MPQVIWSGQPGCLLPTLIIFNLFFGRLIFRSTYLWLGIEVALILLLMIKVGIFMRKVGRQFGRGQDNSARRRRGYGKGGEVIDVEGEVIEEKEKPK